MSTDEGSRVAAGSAGLRYTSVEGTMSSESQVISVVASSSVACGDEPRLMGSRACALCSRLPAPTLTRSSVTDEGRSAAAYAAAVLLLLLLRRIIM